MVCVGAHAQISIERRDLFMHESAVKPSFQVFVDKGSSEKLCKRNFYVCLFKLIQAWE